MSFDVDEFKAYMSAQEVVNLDVAEAHLKVMADHFATLRKERTNGTVTSHAYQVFN